MQIIMNLIIGLLGGLLGGMGMGGGTILIPILVIFLKINQHMAQALNLIVFIPMALTAIIIHIKNNLIKWRYLIYISLGGVIVSIFISIFSFKISDDFLRKLFGIFILIIGIWLFLLQIYNSVKKRKNSNKQKR